MRDMRPAGGRPTVAKSFAETLERRRYVLAAATGA